ncbi:MAG: hypothetical protein V3R71_05180 [Gemmatimonadales bacterium]
MTNLTATTAMLAATSLIVVSALSAQDIKGEEALESDLAKKSQNPIANLISLPFQNNTTFGVGPGDATVNTFNIQPVYPVTAGKFNIINRFIMPVVYQGEVVPGIGSEFGLGDLSYTAFVSPAKASGVTWGVGPSFLFPTATDDRLGSGKWAAGLGIVVLATPGKWVVGALAQNVWSFAGDSDRADVNSLLVQYFVSYITPAFYLTSAPIITANWEAESGQQWTIPFGGGAGKLIHVGKTPVDIQAQAFYNVVKPDFAGDWSLRLQFKLLFPK